MIYKINMKGSTTKVITIILAVLVVTLLVVDVVFGKVIKKDLEEVQRLRTEVAESQNDSNIVLLKREMGTATEALDLLQSYLVGREESIAFIETIESVARNEGVALTVQGVNVETVEGTEDDPGHNELVVETKLLSSWSSMMEFLIIIENLPYNVEISDFRLSSTFNSELGRSEWSANMVLRAISD